MIAHIIVKLVNGYRFSGNISDNSVCICLDVTAAAFEGYFWELVPTPSSIIASR